MADILILDQEDGAGDEKTRKIRNWLSPSRLNFGAMQSDIFGQRQSGTGEWLLADEKFRSWIRGEIKYLWCPGGRNSFS
jgi:hypothetical protein